MLIIIIYNNVIGRTGWRVIWKNQVHSWRNEFVGAHFGKYVDACNSVNGLSFPFRGKREIRVTPFFSFLLSSFAWIQYIYMYPIPGDNKDFQLDLLLFCR